MQTPLPLPLLMLLALAGASSATAADASSSADDDSEPQLIAAYKRQPFKYYTADDLYEFRRRSSPDPQAEADDGEDADDVGWAHRRYRRHAKRSEAPRSAVLELLVVVDNGLYEAHVSRIANSKSKSKQSVKDYYEYFVGYINKVFEGALANFKVTVVPAGIAVIKKKNPRDWSESNRVTDNGKDFLLANDALKEFRKWLERHRARLPAFDHAVALTQYLTGIRKDGVVYEIKGIAQLGQMCRVTGRINSVSLVHDSGTLAGALTAVHEIAHSFGVTHDGERGAAACPDDGQFVMSAALAMSETATKFTECSQRMLLQFLESPKSACLFKSEANADRRLVETNVLPGQIYSKDFQCQRQTLAGFKDPHFCKIPWFTPTTLEMSCTSLYCQEGANPSSMKCAGSVPAIMGTPCGNKKICLNNRCTISPTAPCCPLEVEDAAACGRMQQMGLSCQHNVMKLYCCKFCNHTCD